MTDDFISGEIADENDEPLEGATIIAVEHPPQTDIPEQGEVQETNAVCISSDSNGEYEFTSDDLLSGVRYYHVVANNGTPDEPESGDMTHAFIQAEGE